MLTPCNDIHMWFMRIAIDVVFVRPLAPSATGGAAGGATHEVCSTREDLRPWRPLPVRDGRARETLELPAGTVRRCGISAGDQLCIS